MPDVWIKQPSWLEKRSGHLISAVFFLALFLKMWTTVYTYAMEQPEFETIRVMISPTSTAPNPEPLDPVIPPPDVAATRQSDTPDEQEDELQEPLETIADAAPEPATQSEPAFLVAEDTAPVEPEPEIDPLDKPLDLEQSRRRAEAMARELQSEQDELRDFLRKERSSLEARKYDYTSEGDLEGAVRTFDVSNVDEAGVQLAFKRYGIKVMQQFVTGSESSGYLNAAKTRKSVFTNRGKPGLYEVFQISQRAQAKMSELERYALIERGLDPASTQVQEVIFSVGEVDGEWDLLITTFKARQID